MNEFLTDKKRPEGRPPVFESPEELWQAAVDYFKWAADNPLLEMQYKQSGGEPIPVYIERLRPLTKSALCIYNGIGSSTLHDYSKKPQFSEITKRIDDIIRNQKYEGAASGFFNPNIIAYDLGLNKEQAQELPPINIEIVDPRGNSKPD